MKITIDHGNFTIRLLIIESIAIMWTTKQKNCQRRMMSVRFATCNYDKTYEKFADIGFEYFARSKSMSGNLDQNTGNYMSSINVFFLISIFFDLVHTSISHRQEQKQIERNNCRICTQNTCKSSHYLLIPIDRNIKNVFHAFNTYILFHMRLWAIRTETYFCLSVYLHHKIIMCVVAIDNLRSEQDKINIYRVSQ